MILQKPFGGAHPTQTNIDIITDVIKNFYIAYYSLDLGAGLVLHRFRAHSGGRYLMRLVHSGSGLVAEREYFGSDIPARVLEELKTKLQTELVRVDSSLKPPLLDS